MTYEELEGSNLGQKHKSYNTLVKKAIDSNELQLENFDPDEPDIHNLLKIDVASARRDVNYLMKVLVCEDLLYVSRVIKKCKWLVTDNNYSHIINPQYLHSTLLIKMCTKAANKLLKNIQIHLKDEKRVEQFYEYETDPREAVKWLPHCSVEFTKNKLVQHIEHLKLSELKRISAKSIALLEVYCKNCDAYKKAKALQATTFLLHTETNKYLDLLKDMPNYNYVKFSASETKSILECNPDLIMNNFVQFDGFIHIPTFIKFLKKENIEEFLLKLSRNKETRYGVIMDKKHLQQFLEAMQEKQRFEFVRKVFIDKIFKDDSNALPGTEKSALRFFHDTVNENEYFFYQYAPFETAFNKISKLLESETYIENKKSMLTTLIISAKKNYDHIHSIIDYFHKQNFNSHLDLKCHLVKETAARFELRKLKTNSWKLLENMILKSNLDDSEEAQVLIRFLIVYKVLCSQFIPNTIEKQLKFDSFKLYKSRLKNEEKVLIFTYLYNFISKDIKVIGEKDDEIDESIKNIRNAFILLNDWDKDLKDYPLIINEVKRLIKMIKPNSSYDIDFVYDTNKSWRKYMFEDSLRLRLNKYTLINAIKHDSSLIKRYSDDKECKKLTSLACISHFLKKVKIYFSPSLTVDLRLNYIDDLGNTSNHVAITRGVLELLSREDVLNILEKYAPKSTKITDAEIDGNTLSLQRHFAKNMHQSRPQPPPDVILSFAKGDYLQYALPSLHAIFYNLNKIKSRIFIPKLLDSRVSLQKHGIRFAFKKLESHELTDIFSTMWKNTKNFSIRSVIFKVVFELLCKERDSSRKEEIWKLLTILINNLTLKEEKVVYDLLFSIEKIPSEFRSKYYVHVFPFLETLANADKENYSYNFLASFIPYARELMDEISSEFVNKMLLDRINKKFDENKDEYFEYYIYPVLSAYLLCSTNSNSQIEKYNQIFIPFFKRCLDVWNELKDGKFYKRNILQKLLDHLCQDVPIFSLKNNHIIPYELFLTIQNQLENSFTANENYVMLVKWKLAVAFVKAIEERKLNEWNDSCLHNAERLGQICNSLLKEDCETHFPYIYTLFAEALEHVLQKLVEEEVKYNILLSMLHNKDFIEAYLVVIKLTPKHESNDILREKNDKLRNTIIEHPSLEVKIHHHYRHRYKM